MKLIKEHWINMAIIGGGLAAFYVAKGIDSGLAQTVRIIGPVAVMASLAHLVLFKIDTGSK